MNIYTENEILRIAKRINNQKRTYLLVNPLQAKHIPVSPKESLRMMKTLGDMLAQKYPRTKLIIGFAETATAIGAVVAESFSSQCVYIHTTRENVAGVERWVQFLEEHSHAAEQSLAGDDLSDWICATDSILFVDDEISTGKTLTNIIAQLKQQYPGLNGKTIVAASLLNRVSEEDEKKLTAAGITCEYLLKLPPADYDSEVKNIAVCEAPPGIPVHLEMHCQTMSCGNFENARLGTEINRYKQSCEAVAEMFYTRFAQRIPRGASVLVLGTEECMYPALKIGAVLENMGQRYHVRCHATTRSPIGICADENYPVTSGYRLQSFYDSNRTTYIYNLCEYDAVIVVADTPAEDFSGLESLAGALPNKESLQLFYIQGGKNLWYRKD